MVNNVEKSLLVEIIDVKGNKRQISCDLFRQDMDDFTTPLQALVEEFNECMWSTGELERAEVVQAPKEGGNDSVKQ